MKFFTSSRSSLYRACCKCEAASRSKSHCRFFIIVWILPDALLTTFKSQSCVGRRHVDGGIQIASPVLYKALIGDAAVITAIKIIRRYVSPPSLLGIHHLTRKTLLVWLVLPYLRSCRKKLSLQHTRPFIEVVAFCDDAGPRQPMESEPYSEDIGPRILFALISSKRR